MPLPSPEPARPDLEQLLRVLTAVKNGDFSQRLPEGQEGIAGELAGVVNELAAMNEQLCAETTRIAREIGLEGRFGGQAEVAGVEGAWKERVEGLNGMAAGLTNQVRVLSHRVTGIAMGDLTHPRLPPAAGEMAELFRTVDLLVDTLAEHAAALEPAAATGDAPPEVIRTWALPGRPIRRTANRVSIAWSINQLAAAALARGDCAWGQALYREGLVVGEELDREGNRWWLAPPIEGIASLIAARAAATADAHRAARLLGAAQAIRERLGRPLPAPERERQAAVPLARLGDTDFKAALAEGRQLPAPEAIAEALAASGGQPPARAG
jgi:hypothetical protein